MGWAFGGLFSKVRAPLTTGGTPNTVQLGISETGQEEGGGQNARATGGPGILPGTSNSKTSAN